MANPSNLDWYKKMMLGVIPVSFALLMFLIFSHSSDFLFSEWFLNLIAVPAFVSSHLSTAGYLGRAIDATSPKSTMGKVERIATILGLTIGLALGITLVLVSHAIPLIKPLSVIAEILFSVSAVSTFAGLGNRIGQCVDKKARLPNEKYSISTAITLGLVLSIILLAAKCAAVVSVVGVTSFLSGGAALPLWIAGAVFVTSFSSTCASSADYAAKGFNYIRHKSSDMATKKIIQSRLNEYRGAFVGSSTGLIIAGVILGALIVSQPYLFVGIVSVITAAMIVTACISTLGGLFSRIGRLVDARQLAKEKIVSLQTTISSDKVFAREKQPLTNETKIDNAYTKKVTSIRMYDSRGHSGPTFWNEKKEETHGCHSTRLPLVKTKNTLNR